MTFSALWRLPRFDKPIGIILLWAPVAWALWLANQGRPPVKLFLLFLAGTVVMRAAGCVVNDMADRKVDYHVKRTQNRPLARGEVTLWQALFLLAVLLSIALGIVLCLPLQCFYYALIALALTLVYPFCKRFIDSPQLILGLAFSMAIPMVFAASGAADDGRQWLLLVINMAWVLAYDTQYAMADREDDLRIGVKSSAILFARYDVVIIGLLQLFFHFLWFGLLQMLTVNVWAYGLWFLAGGILIYQHYLTATRNPERCFKAFLSNGCYGMVLWLTLW